MKTNSKSNTDEILFPKTGRCPQRRPRVRLNAKNVVVIGMLLFFVWGCGLKKDAYYTAADFEKVPKIDGHFHYNTTDTRVLEFAGTLNFRLLCPNVNASFPIDSQLTISKSVKQRFPQSFAFFGTFLVDSFSRADFAEKTIARIDECMEAGASGIKIWKNIGMVLKDRDGKYVMVDDAGFEPVFKYLNEKKIPVLGHLGEPRNCWLPADQMTLGNDRDYFVSHPQYHMFLHPDAPSYEDQIKARDNLLQKNRGLDFTGAHLASLEWNVDELAKRFERFPELKADLAERIGHLQYQSLTDRDRVRNFLIKYQDRILYATDVTISHRDTNYIAVTNHLRHLWMDHWTYLATDGSVIVNELDKKEVKGLNLPAEVIDKIYFKNAERFFNNVKL